MCEIPVYRSTSGLLMFLLSCRDDPEAVEILASDIQRLDPLEFLNDTVIDFYIKYVSQLLEF